MALSCRTADNSTSITPPLRLQVYAREDVRELTGLDFGVEQYEGSTVFGLGPRAQAHSG